MGKKFMKDEIIALHGFLGGPWDFLSFDIPHKARSINSWALNSFEDWSDGFSKEISDNIVLGYSLGARLLLHALIKKPQKAAIIISAHPGLKQNQHSRLQDDLAWAKRFRRDPWADVIKSWNEQEIFKKSQKREFLEENYQREELALMLENFSLGKQADLRPQINQLDMPILWIQAVGEEEKVLGIELKHPHSKLIILNGGHRILFDEQAEVLAIIQEFLDLIGCLGAQTFFFSLANI